MVNMLNRQIIYCVYIIFNSVYVFKKGKLGFSSDNISLLPFLRICLFPNRLLFSCQKTNKKLNEAVRGFYGRWNFAPSRLFD